MITIREAIAMALETTTPEVLGKLHLENNEFQMKNDEPSAYDNGIRDLCDSVINGLWSAVVCHSGFVFPFTPNHITTTLPVPTDKTEATRMTNRTGVIGILLWLRRRVGVLTKVGEWYTPAHTNADNVICTFGRGLSIEQTDPIIRTPITFSIRRDAPTVWSWVITAGAKTLSARDKAPLETMFTTLLKALGCADAFDENSETAHTQVLNNPATQRLIKDLANLSPKPRPYYFYLVDDKIEDHYQMFSEYTNSTSCMAKSADDYGAKLNGEPIHPISAYNKTNYFLMLLSKFSPEEMQAALDENVSDHDFIENFDYPFTCRLMVLPFDEYIGEGKDNIFTPFVFGKAYGHEALVNFFYDDDRSSDVFNRNNNELLTQVPLTTGGRLQYIEVDGGDLLLPYIDRENKVCVYDFFSKNPQIIVGQDNMQMKDPSFGTLSFTASGYHSYGLANVERVYSPIMHNSHRYVSNLLRDVHYMETPYGMEWERIFDESDDYRTVTHADGTTGRYPRVLLVRDKIDGEFIMRRESNIVHYYGDTGWTTCYIHDRNLESYTFTDPDGNILMNDRATKNNYESVMRLATAEAAATGTNG